MKKYLSIILLVPLLFSCGSNSGSDSASTEAGTTPLVENDESTQTGTYAVRSMRITYSTGEVIDSNDFDSFDSYFTIDYTNNKLTMLLNWEDSDYGDFHDYFEDDLSGSTSATVGDIYVTQTGDYDLTIYYNNICDSGYCADMLLRIRKISDTVRNLLQRPSASSSDADEEFVQKIIGYGVKY